MTNFDKFLKGYINALMLSSSVLIDPKVNEIARADQYQLSEEAKEKCKSDCQKFFTINLDSLKEVTKIPYSIQYNYEGAGQDFLLSRNDKGGYFGHAGKSWYVLHDSAKKFGKVNLFINDEGELDFL